MNKFLLVALTLVSVSAFADNKTVTAGDRTSLPECGGTLATSLNDNRQIVLKFDGVKSCSNFDIVKSDSDTVVYENQKLGGENGDRSGSFTIPKAKMGEFSVTITVKSNSGKTSDQVTIKLPAKKRTAAHTMFINDEINLDSSICGGSVATNNGGNDTQLNVVFRSVQKCSVFDIVKADGYKVDKYDAKELQENAKGYYGSYSIPTKLLGIGFSTVNVVVRSADGLRSENIQVKYFRF